MDKLVLVPAPTRRSRSLSVNREDYLKLEELARRNQRSLAGELGYLISWSEQQETPRPALSLCPPPEPS